LVFVLGGEGRICSFGIRSFRYCGQLDGDVCWPMWWVTTLAKGGRSRGWSSIYTPWRRYGWQRTNITRSHK